MIGYRVKAEQEHRKNVDYAVNHGVPRQVFDFLDALTDEQRQLVMYPYCKECGSKDPGCQCWNNE